MKKLCVYLGSLAILAILTVSCNEPKSTAQNSVLVICQGTAVSGGSVTQYNTVSTVVERSFYEKANAGSSLGVMPMSMSVYNRLCWVPTEGSVMIFDPITGAFNKRIPNLRNPSFVGFFANAAYITDWRNSKIYAYNLNSNKMFDTIALSGPADKIVSLDESLYTNLWSFGTKIVKINPYNGKLTDSLEVGIQPSTLLVDQHKNLWTLTDGGYPGNPLGDVAPEIVKVSTSNKMSVINKWTLVDGPNYQLAMSVWGTHLYFLAGDKVFSMDVNSSSLPTTPVIEVAGANFSAMAENPFTGELYIADSGNWVSNGKVYRYSKDFKLIGSFETGPNPISFCFVQ